jgi:hypothetical protein
MSFRLFIYYCAFCGGWAAFLAWAFGRPVSSDSIPGAGFKGLLLGMLIAAGLGLVDALLNLDYRQVEQIAKRVGITVGVGCAAGLVGGMFGQALYGVVLPYSSIFASVFLIMGWTITGFLIGGSIGAYDVLTRIQNKEDIHGAMRKVINGVIGGTAGGLVGGLALLVIGGIWMAIFSNKNRDELWSPSAMGFVILGMCIGLLIGLAQVLLKEAWVKVEAGFRAGREMILSKPETTIGRAEACDIGLFGDAKAEKLHAKILQQENRYLLADVGTPGGTFLNGKLVQAPTPLHSGDEIRVGNSVLRFREKQKSGAPA